MAGKDICTVRQNDQEGGRLITHLLLGKGAKNFFLLLPSMEWPAMLERERGVRGALKNTGAKVFVVRCGDEGIVDTTSALSAAIVGQGLPHAIIGGNDRMAIAALKVLAEMKICVPEQVRVTGYNAFEFFQYATPSLTTVRSPAYDMGRRAGELMLARLKDGYFSEPEVVFPVELVLGDSA